MPPNLPCRLARNPRDEENLAHALGAYDLRAEMRHDRFRIGRRAGRDDRGDGQLPPGGIGHCEPGAIADVAKGELRSRTLAAST